MDKKTTDEQMSCHCCCCCNASAMCGGNHKWLWSLLRIALLLAILAGVFHMGVRVGMGGGMGDHRNMMHKGRMMGCPMMNKGNWNKDENMMRGDHMMNKSANTTTATGEVAVSAGEVVGTGQ